MCIAHALGGPPVEREVVLNVIERPILRGPGELDGKAQEIDGLLQANIWLRSLPSYLTDSVVRSIDRVHIRPILS